MTPLEMAAVALAGVAAGVAEFFGLDPTLVRVLWFISILFGGLGVVIYIGLALIVGVAGIVPFVRLAVEEVVEVAL